MNDKVSFSIVIPVYNTSLDRVKRCVDSINKQTYKNYDVFIVDDGSEEQYSKQLKDFVLSCVDTFHYYRQANLGAGEARNTGIRLADKEYLMFVDADDIISPYALREAAVGIQDYGADLVLGLVHQIAEKDLDWNIFSESKEKASLVETEKQKEDLICALVGAYQPQYYFSDGYLSDGPIARVIRTEIAKSCFFDAEDIWNEDTIWNVRLLRQCKKIAVCGNVWYEYLVNLSSLTRTYRPNIPSEFREAVSKDIKIIDELWPECKNRLYVTMVWNMSYVSRMYLYHPASGFSKKDSFREFKKFLHYPDYRYVLKHVDFSNDHRFVHRCEKEILRFFSLHEPHYIAYMIWKAFSRQHQNG
ncbi:glycosyltransferase family A protein [Candidatus Weimeria sp. HCP3S3_B5]|uniref:glycosyltransferase family A protein n=1 Tax=Candidatus Weimeria sp. HCP3S3_B5 TaxID=3438871 RepID=UPI003F8A37C4